MPRSGKGSRPFHSVCLRYGCTGEAALETIDPADQLRRNLTGGLEIIHREGLQVGKRHTGESLR